MMNDFTQEELQSILSWANVYTEFRTSWTYSLHKPLIDRIQSMIDIYCEHQETVNIGGWVSKCVKCGMKFGDETQ